MKNARPGFVIDPYRFDGSFLTSMSDGIHCDYTHKTLEELRAGEDNPRLVTVSRNTADKMFRIHLKSKCLPFKEITESQYYENMDMLPPVRHTRNFFFIGEPCFRDLWKSHSTLTLLATQNYPFLLKYDCPLWLK